MKKIVFLAVLAGISIGAYSQAVVTDPGLTQLAIEEAAERKTIISKTPSLSAFQ